MTSDIVDTVLILSVIGTLIYNLITVPALSAEIARRKGLDVKRWVFNNLFLGLGLIYLRFSLDEADRDLKRRLDQVLTINTVLGIWIIGLIVYFD